MSAYQTSQVKVTNVLDGEQTYQATEALLAEDIKSQAKSATPAKTPVVVTPDEGYLLSEVNIAAVTSDVDENITAGNIKAGVEILGVTGTLQPNKPGQEKTVTPGLMDEIVVPDAGYELTKVTVEAISLQGKSVTPTTSLQIVNADSDYTALRSVTVQPIRTEQKTITANGTYTPTAGKFFDEVIVNVPQSIPEDVATEAALTAKLVAANLGKAYRYTGTTGTYTNGNIYVVEEA